MSARAGERRLAAMHVVLPPNDRQATAAEGSMERQAGGGQPQQLLHIVGEKQRARYPGMSQHPGMSGLRAGKLVSELVSEPKQALAQWQHMCWHCVAEQQVLSGMPQSAAMISIHIRRIIIRHHHHHHHLRLSWFPIIVIQSSLIRCCHRHLRSSAVLF